MFPGKDRGFLIDQLQLLATPLHSLLHQPSETIVGAITWVPRSAKYHSSTPCLFLMI